MATESAFILQMEADIRYHSQEIAKWQSSLNALKAKRKGKSYQTGSRELYHSLIEFYGQTKGKQMWAAHLRNRREQTTNIRRHIWFHQAERRSLKQALAVYAK